MKFKSGAETLKENSIWIAMFVFLGLIILVALTNEPGNQFAQTYQYVWVATILMFMGSVIATPSFEFVGVNKNGYSSQILIGIIIGFLLVGGVLFGGQVQSIIGSLVVPFTTATVPVGGVLLLTAFSSLFIYGFFVVEVEESFMTAFRATIEEWLSRDNLRLLVFLVSAVLIWFYMSSWKFISYILLLIVFADYIILPFLTKQRVLKPLLKKRIYRFAVSLVFKGILFAILHYYAAVSSGQDPSGYMVAAFAFAVIGGIGNDWFKSTLPSRIAHSINNTAIVALSIGANPILSVGAMLAFYLVYTSLVYNIDITKLDFRFKGLAKVIS